MYTCHSHDALLLGHDIQLSSEQGGSASAPQPPLCHISVGFKGLKQVVRRQYNASSLPVKCSLNSNVDRSSESKAIVDEPPVEVYRCAKNRHFICVFKASLMPVNGLYYVPCSWLCSSHNRFCGASHCAFPKCIQHVLFCWLLCCPNARGMLDSLRRDHCFHMDSEGPPLQYACRGKFFLPRLWQNLKKKKKCKPLHTFYIDASGMYLEICKLKSQRGFRFNFSVAYLTKQKGTLNSTI